MSKNASAADDASPISVAEANRLFSGLAHFPSLVLAVSGGPDSTALMVLAARWRGRAQTPRLVAVTVDHGLRRESKREAAVVARLAQKLGIEHRTLRWTGRKPKTGLQEAARLARYRLLSKVAKEIGARYVLTAHTLDDQAETVLFRLARGSGISGLAGMYPSWSMPVEEGVGLELVRPLLQVPKSRLIATLKAAKTRYADDPSNRDPRFTRSRLRELMPMLACEGLTASRLALFASRVQRVEETIFDVLAHANTKAVIGKPSDDGPVTNLHTDVFSDLPREIAIRVLGWTIKRAGSGRVELGKLEAFYAAMHESLDVYSLPPSVEPSLKFAKFRRTLAGAVVTVDRDKITIEPAPPRKAGLRK
ncbi:MAG: tRNA lysidine(34) synthetase TilS [Rhizobiales bacterium]|nr:tRNA lysidine(34) synthetase TilS [Hyphomicrobiales bacterium]